MSGNANIEARIQALEEKLAFQDDLIDQLNQVVSQHSFEVKKLWDANRLLRQKMDDARGPEAEGSEAPPPHY